MRRALPFLLILAAVLALAPAAGAAIPWQACPGLAGYDCAHVDVPLDRTGATPGTVSLATVRAAASSNPRRSAVVALAGGPGQAALPLGPDFADVLGPALTDRDLLLFDQRGTGSSGPLDCQALHNGGSLTRVTRSCAQELGTQRAFYRTPDSVEDIEALRVAGDYDKLVLFGVSYGTKVALAYAAAHPDHVEALVLDSVVLPEGPDAFRRSSLGSVQRVLRDLCAGRACRRATPSVRSDLTKLARQLRQHTLQGTVVDSAGRREPASLGQSGLFGILLAGDLNPTLRAELPGAMRAALRKDPTPLLRLSVRSAGLQNGAQAQSSADSDALFLATTCEETRLPWTRGAPVTQRAQEAERASTQISKTQLGPFSPRVALQDGVVPLCLGWPEASAAPGDPAALPQVPTLVLDGQMDLRTPVEDAQQVPARIPGAQLVTIPYTGHSVLGSDQSSCAKKALATFFAAQPEAPCPKTANPYAPTPRPPTSLDGVKGIGPKGKTGRTVAAALATVTDARRQVVGEALAVGVIPSRVGGLRAGTVTASSSTMRLDGYEYVPGVKISGSIANNRSGTITVSGPAGAHGRLKIGKGGKTVSGTLAGRRVTVSAASAVAGDGLPTLTHALERARLR